MAFATRSSSIFTSTTITPSTTGEAARATDGNITTAYHRVVYIADVLGNTSIATGPASDFVVGTALNTGTVGK